MRAALVLVDQFIDRTRTRPSSFFGEGLAAHVSMADPVSPLLCGAIANAASAEQVALVRGGTYLAIEGPQFSTRGKPPQSGLGRRRHWHDQYARSQARSRG